MIMSHPGEPNKVAAALNYLRSHSHFVEFDDRERVVRVTICGAANADEIAAHVGHLRDLRKLIFDRTDLTDEGLRHLRRLVKLRYLWLCGARITATGLACLGAMSRLEDVYIKEARDLDHEAFKCIARLASVQKLTFRGGNFYDADLAPLAALVNLEQLSVSENENVLGICCAHLIALPRLRYLKPGDHITDDGLASIAKLAGLEVLFLDGQFSDAGLRQIRTLQKLQALYVTSEHATNEGLAVLADLPALTELGLNARLVTDDGIAWLARCRGLTKIVIFKSGMTSSGVIRLREALPDCEIRDLDDERRANSRDDAGIT